MNHRLALLATLLALACANTAEDLTLAVYEGGEVTTAEYAASINPRRPDADAETTLRRIALIERLAADAEAHGLSSEPELRLRLASLELQPWVRALEQDLHAASAPSEEAVAAYLDDHRDRLDKPRKVRLSNIFKRATDGAKDSVRREMEAIHARLVAGEDFRAIAKVESEAVNRFRGGKMGAVPPGQMKRELEAIAFALGEGELSPVLELDGGFVILRCDGFVEAHTMGEQEALDRIRAAMTRWNYDDAKEQLRQALFEEAGLTIHADRFAAADETLTVATFADFEWSYGEIVGLLEASSPRRSPGDVLPTRWTAVIESAAFTHLAAARARALGLAVDPAKASRAAVERHRLLATAELEFRAREQPLEISLEEVRSFFDDNRQRFALPDRGRLGVIQLLLDEDPETLRRKTLIGREAVESIRSGEVSFADAARRISEHPSAAAGGDIGWRPRRWAAGLGPNVLHAFDDLEVGEVTDLVRQDHLWILTLMETEPGRQLTFDEARDAARDAVERQRVNERAQAAERVAAAELDRGFRIIRLPETPTPEPATDDPGD